LKFIDEFIVNKVNETESYGVDLRNSDSVVIKFSGVSSFFAQGIISQESEDQIISNVLENYEIQDKAVVAKDFSNFISYLNKLNVLA